MIKEIEARKIPTYVCKRGPYVVYCYAESGGINFDIVSYIRKMSTIFKKVTFLEIKWKAYKEFKLIYSDDYMNTIYGYYEGRQEISEDASKYSNIVDFFRKLTYLHNKSVEMAILLIGSKSNEPNDEAYFPISNKKRYMSKFTVYRREYKKRELSNHKMDFSKIKMPPPYMDSKLDTPKWFYDVKFTSLPNDVFEDNHLTQIHKQDKIINKNIIKENIKNNKIFWNLNTNTNNNIYTQFLINNSGI